MSKIFCDPIHGQISLHPVCVAIIDTPQFQRLRHIKQTGLLEYVFPGATHNRFGHSLGVCYLAGKFMKQLRERQSELNISETDILCVEVAALCHDLGHGPLSHTWENYMHAYSQKTQSQKVWKHEDVSKNMFDFLVYKNHLSSKLKAFGIGATEMQLIKSLIAGSKPSDKDKAFIFEIVNNEDSGLDVDKWDYFLRDCHYLGIATGFQYERLMQSAKVLTVNGRKEICYRDKVLENVYDVFRTRSNLHKKAYQHRVVKILDAMFCDAVLQADEKVIGPSGQKLCFWQWSMNAAFANGPACNEALQNFSSLTDDLLLCSLKHCQIPEVVSLINAIEMRSYKDFGIYTRIALQICPFTITTPEMQEMVSRHLPLINHQVMSNSTSLQNESNSTMENDCLHTNPVTMDDIHIEVVTINWGKKSSNPVQSVHFYGKDDSFILNKEKLEESTLFLPKVFQETELHVLCKRSDDFAIDVTKKCFKAVWMELNASHL